MKLFIKNFLTILVIVSCVISSYICVNLKNQNLGFMKRENENAGSVKPLSENMRKKIIEKINTFRNKVAKGIFEFEMSQDQKGQLETLPNAVFYKLDGLKASVKIGKLPPAKKMKRVYWSNDLENKAALWAQKCTTKNSPEISSGTPGQNKGQISEMKHFKNKEPEIPPWGNVFDSWFDGITSDNFNIKHIDSFEFTGKGASHFAQLIFEDLTEIGCSQNSCGKTKSTHPNSDKDALDIMFVCFLSPQGPLMKKPIYERPTKKEDVGKVKCKNIKEPYPYLCSK